MSYEFIPYYQPIYDCWTNKVYGYEATTKAVVDGKQVSFEQLYDHVVKNGKDSAQLDRLARNQCISHFFSKQQDGVRLFVNLSPLSIGDAWFLEDVQKNISQIVLEITENSKLNLTPRINERFDSLKKNGMLIALDDFGKNYSNFKLVYELQPDFIKLDKYFTENLHSPHSHNIIRGMVLFSNQTNISLIAEGIETAKQKEILLNLGVRYMQGYYLGKPEASNSLRINRQAQ